MRGCEGDWVIDTDFDRFLRKVTACRSTVPVGGALNRTNVPTSQQPQVLEFEAGTHMKIKSVSAEYGGNKWGRQFWNRFVQVHLVSELNDEADLFGVLGRRLLEGLHRAPAGRTDARGPLGNSASRESQIARKCLYHRRLF